MSRHPRSPRRRVALSALAGVLALLGIPSALGFLPLAPADGRPGAVRDVHGAPASTEPDPDPADAAPPEGRPLGPPAPLAARTGERARPLPPERLTGYRWPLPRGRLTLPFGPTPWGSRLVDGDPFHDGIDLATFCGDRIVAAHAGRVLAAGRRYDQVMGWRGDLRPYLRRVERLGLWSTLPIVVVIDDGNGYRSVYAHFSRVAVRVGQRVRAGQLLGYEGATGRASGCHLHYSLFSPAEEATMAIRPDVRRRMRLPALETARIDPLLVLPDRNPPPPAPAPPPRSGR